jgi:hypothetical protein
VAARSNRALATGEDLSVAADHQPPLERGLLA